MAKIALNGTPVNDINLENFKYIIKNIAIGHSQEINDETKNVLVDKREFNIRKIVASVISMEEFKALDQATLDEQLKILEDSVKSIMDSSILVKDQGIKKLVPLSYEVLRLILNSTNEKFRQQFFHELVEYYYNELTENMKKISVTSVLEKEIFDQQVKVLLPFIKFEVANQLLGNNDLESQHLLKEIISNIISFIKYPRLNKEDIFSIVNKKLESKQYELLSYELIQLQERNGHLGDYFKLKINVEFEDTKKVINLFAKFLTPHMEMMKEVLLKGPSKKEDFFYMIYLPLLEEYGLKTLLDFSPNCYFSRLNDVLILDDMVSLGYTALTPNIKLDFESLMFVVKKISKLHACSMILEELLSQKQEKEVTLFDIYSDYLQEVLFQRNENNKVGEDDFNGILNVINYLVDRFPEFTKNITADKLKEKITKGLEKQYELVNKSEKFKNTICHGDMYVANMLFKFDLEGICSDATLVDFQILRYCPPAHDLLFFIYQNSFRNIREKHLKDLTDMYYDELSRHLEHFNLDIARIYPKENFEESLRYMKLQGIFQSMFYSPFCMIDPSLREEIFQNPELAKKYFVEDRTALIDLGLKNDDYRRALGGLIEDIVELCESGIL